METSISSKSDSIQIIYDNYTKEKYIVNRRYQRKLVWNLEEKIAFIDSIYKKFSVPLFLLAQYDKDKSKYEIIDGMQRLNAIFSFIENEFPIIYGNNLCYFDLQTLASTKEKLDKKELKQKTPILDRQICMAIVSYQLPFSYVIADRESIEEIFRRINSFGRQLSKQEIRQAGALGIFPDIVRKISSQIRGDVSDTDEITLNKMTLISLSNKKLDYGLDLNKIFWVKNHIVTVQNMRISRDEEIIALILSYMIMGKSIQTSAKTLDKLYHYELDDVKGIAAQVEDRIKQIGEDIVLERFNRTYNTFCQIFIPSEIKDFRSVIFGENDVEGTVRSFQVVFLAIYELVVLESMVISDKKDLISVLNNIGKNHLKGIATNSWDESYRYQKIQAIKGIIKPYFKVVAGQDVVSINWVSELENLIHLSSIENAQYDFKLGFHSLDDGTLNKDLLRKCVQILTAEVNVKKNSKGYVVVGIIEGENTAKKFKQQYNVSPLPVENSKFFVSGLNAEIDKYYKKDGDLFIRSVKKVINEMPIDDNYKKYILMNMKFVKYYDRDVLVLELKSEDTPVLFDNCIYIREGSDTRKIETPAETIAFMKAFAL